MGDEINFIFPLVSRGETRYPIQAQIIHNKALDRAVYLRENNIICE